MLSSPTYAFAQICAPALETWYALACPQHIVDRLISQVAVPDNSTDIPGRRTFVSEERRSSVAPEMLSERWGIVLVQARNTIKITTQKGVRLAAVKPEIPCR